jgi:hypothetical protein
MFKNREELKDSIPRGTIKKLSKKHNCSRTYIANIINGKTDNPDILEEIVQIALKSKQEQKRKDKINARVRKHLKFKIPNKKKNEQTTT